MSITERLRERRKQSGLTQPEFAQAVKTSLATVRRWEGGKTIPDGDKISDIARVLNTTAAYLLGETDNPNRNAARRGDTLLTRLPGKMVAIKVLSIAACMVKGFDNEGEPTEVIDEILLSPSDVGIMGPEEPFALVVEGNSMAPLIEDGDRVVVNPNIPPGRSEACLARFRDGGYLRDAVKFYFPTLTGGIVLKSSETSGVLPMEFTAQEVRDGDIIIVGRIMSFGKWRRL